MSRVTIRANYAITRHCKQSSFFLFICLSGNFPTFLFSRKYFTHICNSFFSRAVQVSRMKPRHLTCEVCTVISVCGNCTVKVKLTRSRYRCKYCASGFHLLRWNVRPDAVTSSGKTGGPFETSITGTCHLVDVTTASEFVIALPLPPSLSVSLLLSLSLSHRRPPDLSLLIARIFGLARN